jgi:hypothetical protein
MKLWVDDIRNAPDETWHVARTALEAIRAIARFDFDAISLDHDISHQVHMDDLSRPYPCAETFLSVAYFIAEKYRSPRAAPVVEIHSSNSVASLEMVSVLRDAGITSKLKPSHLANRLEMEV